jgi:hypothetical protein
LRSAAALLIVSIDGLHANDDDHVLVARGRAG